MRGTLACAPISQRWQACSLCAAAAMLRFRCNIASACRTMPCPLVGCFHISLACQKRSRHLKCHPVILVSTSTPQILLNPTTADRHGVQHDGVPAGGPRLRVGQPPARRHAAGGEREAGAALKCDTGLISLTSARALATCSVPNLLQLLAQQARLAAWVRSRGTSPMAQANSRCWGERPKRVGRGSSCWLCFVSQTHVQLCLCHCSTAARSLA